VPTGKVEKALNDFKGARLMPECFIGEAIMSEAIDIEYAVIVDVEATPARTYDEVAATRMMIERTEQSLGLKPDRLAADTAYGTGKFLGWLVSTGITPQISRVGQKQSRRRHLLTQRLQVRSRA
jgi:hypothetical protein